MFAWARKLLGMAPGGDRRPAPSVPVRGRYEAAQTTDENQKLWALTDLLSSRAANNQQVRQVLRTRSRQEIANNSYARGITLTLANDLIGTGPRLQVRTPDQEANRQIAGAFQQWAQAIGLAEKLRIMKLAKIGDGEAFGLFITNPRVESPVQLDVRVIESDQVTTPAMDKFDRYWVDGLILDEVGETIAYTVLRQHPGDLFSGLLNPLEFDTIKAANVLHWFRKDRPGQVRGIPEITPALELFAQLRRYTKAVISAAELAADFAAVIETDAPAGTDAVVGTAFESVNIDRGMMTTLPFGNKMKQFKPEQPGNLYEAFVRVIIREIARCLNIPLNIALGDSSNFNYSSGRLDHLSYHRQNRVERAHCEATVLDRIFFAWLNEAIMIPRYLPAGVAIDQMPHRWFWDGNESIDPAKDAKADQVNLASNLTTLEELYAERGEDWEPRIRQRGLEIALLRELDITPEQAEPTAGEQLDEPGAGQGGNRQGQAA